MAATASARIRKLLFTIHKWLGISLAILLIPLCLSGLVLMWPDAVNNLTNPPPKVGPAPASLPLAAYLDSAKAALPPTLKIQSLHAPQAPGEAVTVSATAGRAGQTAWLDPATGKALKVGSPQSALWQVSHSFHETLTIGQPGRPLVGILGAAMLYFSLSGLWLWWRRGAFAKSFAWRRTPTTLMNLHYLGGFWVAIPLAVVAVTGMGLSFPQTTAKLFGAPAQQRGPDGAGAAGQRDGGGEQGGRGEGRRGQGRGGEGRGPAGADSAAPASLTADQAVSAAQTLHPGAKLVNLVLPGGRMQGPPIPAPPGGGGGSWRVQLTDGGHTLDVWVKGSGEAADAPPAPPRPGQGATGLIRRLHQGDGGGVIWNLLVALTGVVPVILAVTGVWTWIRLERRRRQAREA